MFSGVVSITMPEQPVHYNSSVQIQCTSEEDLGQDQQWHLETPAKTHEIVEGTISKLKSEQKKATVTLTNINERWEGKYICNYKQKSDLIHLNHKASATMDICHMPMIEAFTEPAFPLCAEESSVFMKTKCRIRKSSENYKVTWKGATIEPTGDKYCKAEGDWAITKRGFSAHLKCHIGVGLRSRKCNSNAEWEAERSDCVTEDLNVVQETAQIIDQGLGHLEKNAAEVFSKFENFTKTSTINSYVNMEVSVSVLSILDSKLSTIEEENMVDDLLDSSSHLLNRSLARTWKENRKENSSLAESYLTSVEQLIVKANITNKTSKPNLEVDTCTGETCNRSVFDVNISLTSSGSGKVKLAGFQQLDGYLPTKTEDDKSTNSIVVVVTKENALEIQSITIDFMLTNSRLRNVELTCVFWDNSSHSWSPNGCEWGGPLDERRCICTHLSAFSILMSKKPLKVPALSQITLVGLSISVASLVISLLIELIVWSKVVKTNTLYLRHAAHVNISVCLLIADCCFLATFEPEHVSERLCVIFAALKHFCYLSMFFWMLCLSSTLLHQAVFLFHKVSKKYYLRFSLVVGYVCPFLIVFVTFLVNKVGAEGSYYSKDTCWLVFKGSMEDSIFTFVIPVGTIVFFNMFSMMVVIIKLLDHHKITQSFDEKEKCAAKTVIRSVILLTPVFGLTWFFGFFVLMFDLTKGLEAFAVNYIFTLLNSFQGLFILLTTCLGDKMTRDALLSYFNKKAPGSISESTTNLNSTCKK
ncbi:adhesion G-protein coupled receptor F3 [Leuresthes tenuis]|uniref:adhesion G-protein coupled receptor F3 n=1 Tax=Leuresthes tenuis TaxID=355514 RepID=UPI003B5083FC